MRAKQALGFSTLAALILVGFSAQAATIRGVLVDGTHGGAGKADLVRVVDVSSGQMDQSYLVEDAEGGFVFEDIVPQPGTPYLLQAQWQGVIYNARVMVPTDDAYETEITVYDSTTDVDGIVLKFHHALFQRDGEHMTVSEVYEFENRTDPPVSVWQGQGAIMLDLPHEIHGEAEVSVNTGSTRLHQELLEVDDDPTKFTVAHPLRPGGTTIFLRYNAHYSPEGFAWAPRMFYPVEDMSFLISPMDIEVAGDGVVAAPEGSPVAGFALYEGPSMDAGSNVDLTLSGGSEKASDPHAGVDMSNQPSPSEPFRVEVRPNRFAAGSARTLGYLGLLIVLSLGIVYGLGTPVPASTESAHLTDRALSQLRQLEDRYIDGHVDRADFERERKVLLTSQNGSHRAAGASAASAGTPRKA